MKDIAKLVFVMWIKELSAVLIGWVFFEKTAKPLKVSKYKTYLTKHHTSDVNYRNGLCFEFQTASIFEYINAGLFKDWEF